MLVEYLSGFMKLLHAPGIFDYSKISSAWCTRYWNMLLISLVIVYFFILVILLIHRKYFNYLPHWLAELLETMLGNREEEYNILSRKFKCVAVGTVLFFPLIYILSWIIYGIACILGWPVPH